jgi:hypothetical protein
MSRLQSTIRPMLGIQVGAFGRRLIVWDTIGELPDVLAPAFTVNKNNKCSHWSFDVRSPTLYIAVFGTVGYSYKCLSMSRQTHGTDILYYVVELWSSTHHTEYAQISNEVPGTVLGTTVH